MSLTTIGKCMKTIGKNLTAGTTIKLANGYPMPLFGIGTSLINDKEAIETTLTTAIDAGYRQIDTAFSYGNLPLIGEALKKIYASGRVKREDLFIVDKVPINGMRDVEHFLLKSLYALQTSYIDMYLIYWPISTQRTANDEEQFPMKDGVLMTDNVDLNKAWKAMEEMKELGYADSIGLSNFNSEQIKRVCDEAFYNPINLQVECHPYLPQNELHALCDERNIALTAYCPIGKPHFPKFLREVAGLDYPDSPVLLEDETLKKIAEHHKKTTAQVSLRYLLQRGISVIPKSSNPERIKSNIQVFDFCLSDEEMDLIASIENGVRYIKMDYFKGLTDHPEYPFKIPY